MSYPATIEPIVTPTPNSLYISTELLMSPGFHWAPIVTNEEGTITRHEWAEDLSRVTAERYLKRVEGQVGTYTREGRLVFAYFRIWGYQVEAGEGIEWEEELGAVFPESCGTWIENRKQKMSCRTWIMRVLELLRERERERGRDVAWT